MATFNERLKILREEKNMTLDELAKALQTTKSTLSRYENSLREPKVDFLSEASTFFGVTTDYLLGKTDERHPIANESDISIYKKFASEIADVIEREGLEYTEDLLEDILNFTEYLIEKKKKQDK